jgi:hypothetical protein
VPNVGHMVRLRIRLTAASGREQGELLESLQFQVPRTRLESGSVGCDAWSGTDHTVQYVEDWGTEADVRRRVLSDRFTSLLGIVEAAAEADVRFEFVTETRGLEYVVEVREQFGRSPGDPT